LEALFLFDEALVSRRELAVVTVGHLLSFIDAVELAGEGDPVSGPEADVVIRMKDSYV
jgi:hypothetical protein